MRLRIPLPLALLVPLALAPALAAPASAQEQHPGHDPGARCTWQADTAPQFVPGSTAVRDTGSTIRTSAVFESVVGRTAWTVVVLPGYHFGWVYAWDEGVPLSSSCNRAYARSSQYGVFKITDCCLPQRTAKPTMSCTFRVRATQLNAPGAASARGVTHIHAVNSGLSCVASAAATTRSEDAGQPVSVQVPMPGGATVRILFNLDFDSEEQSVDSASNLVIGPARAVPDEEYAIVTDLDLEATADGAPWDTAESTADLMEHTLWIRTVVECRHCANKVQFQTVVDDQFWGVEEKSANGQ